MARRNPTSILSVAALLLVEGCAFRPIMIPSQTDQDGAYSAPDAERDNLDAATGASDAAAPAVEACGDVDLSGTDVRDLGDGAFQFSDGAVCVSYGRDAGAPSDAASDATSDAASDATIGDVTSGPDASDGGAPAVPDASAGGSVDATASEGSVSSSR